MMNLAPKPTSMRERRPRLLPVLNDGAQDCSTCRNASHCWRNELEDRAIVSNLLVCRIQRGIARDTSTRLLLALIRPKLMKTARWITKRISGDPDDVVRELESVAIELLLTTYVMGELVAPLVWLFNARHGGLILWARRHTASTLRYRSLHYSLDDNTSDELDTETRLTRLNWRSSGGKIRSAPPMPVKDPEVFPGFDLRYAEVVSVLEDGVTLNATEYRVFAFCLANATGIERVTDWLHKWLAATSGVRRNQISRTYGIAYRQILDRLGLRDSYLAARGVIAPENRRRDRTQALTLDEVLFAVRLIAKVKQHKGPVTMLDVAWALDMSDVAVYQLRRRYGHLTETAIRSLWAKKHERAP